MLELLLDLADDEAVGVGRQQQAHDPQPRFRAHGGEHVGEPRHAV